mgnify:CR=1 FL=1
MKNYRITVNGNVYDVAVEETGAGTAPAAPAAAPKAAPKAAPAAAPKAAAGAQGAVKAPVGTAVTKGQVVMILEAMKMENEIVAPQDGTVASIDVAEGGSVEAGAVLATLN